jgi:uncharacterized membrane protein
MADVTKPVRRGRQRAQQEVSDRGADVQEQVSDRTDDVEGQTEGVQDQAEGVQDQAEGVQEAGERAAGRAGGDRTTVASELKDTIRESAIEILRPVARQATKSAAKYAVTKGPDLVRDRVMPRLEEAGGAGALAKGALSKGTSLARGGDEGGGLLQRLGLSRGGEEGGEGASAVPIQAHVDVASDLQTVYDQFTQFEDFPEFSESIERIEQRDDTTLTVRESGRRGRSWDAEIVEQRPGERIVLRGVGDEETVGVVTFHRLSDQLTRVDVSVILRPTGLLEKMAGVRAYRRALESDLMRFKAWVELRDEATGAWRGRIEEGEVVDAPEDEGGDAEGGDQEEQPRGEEEEYVDEDEGEESEEEEGEEARSKSGRFARERDTAEEGYSDEDEDDVEEEEEEPRPARRAARRRAGAASSRSTGGARRR